MTNDYEADGLQINPRQANRDNEDPLPVCAFGAFFLRDLVWPPTAAVPRMRYGNVMLNSSFKKFFGLTFQDLARKYTPLAFIPRTTVPRTRVATQKGMSKRHHDDDPLPVTAFEDLDFEIPPPPQDIGHDLPMHERIDYPVPLAEPLPVLLTKHWNQFCSDLVQKCGNARGNQMQASHCALTMDERRNVTPAIYKESNLATVFHRVQWKRANGLEWREAFDQFFPPLGTPPRLQPQNFPTMQYWLTWAEMKRDMAADALNEVRTKYWALFKEFIWIPKPYSDRLWKYNPHPDFHVFPRGYTQSAPHILINCAFPSPTWAPERVTGAATFDEEDEDADDGYDHPRAEWVDDRQPIPLRILLREEEEDSE
jgi:hypothetical protein